jgi:hypothetical protein
MVLWMQIIHIITSRSLASSLYSHHYGNSEDKVMIKLSLFLTKYNAMKTYRGVEL